MRSHMFAAAAVLAVPLSLGALPAMVAAEVSGNTSAATAVRAVNDPTLTPTAQATAVPAGLGYRPAAGPGYAVNPHGSCSSVVALPREFDEPCKAHDLGYDILRYADASGQRLGGWARREIDDAFARRLHAACAGGPVQGRQRCDGAAAIAVAAVRLNTWRQHAGPPRRESCAELIWSWATLGGQL